MNVRLIGAAIVICLFPMAAFAQKTSVDYDKSIDFAKYTTYAWRDGRPAPNPLVDQRILDAVDRQLAAKGWTKTGAAPSALVIYRAGVDVQRELNGWSNGPRWSGMGRVTIDERKIGQVLIDIYDASTERLLWRGFASDTISDSADKNEHRINDAMTKLFKQFPPNRDADRGTK